MGTNKPLEIDQLRNHPTYIIERAWATILAIILFLVNGAEGMLSELSQSMEATEMIWIIVAMAVVVGLLLLLVLFHVNRWRKTSISVKDGMLTWRRVTMYTKEDALSIRDISNINLERNLFETIVGTQKVKIDTNTKASADETDFEIVLEAKAAEQFKKDLLAEMKRLQGKAVSTDVAEEADKAADAKEADQSPYIDPDTHMDYDVEFSMGEAIGAAILETNFWIVLFGVFMLVASVFSAVDEVKETGDMGGVLATFIIGLFVSGSLLTNVVKGILDKLQFKAKRQQDKIYVESGLIRRRSYTIPLNKVNAIKWEAGFIGRLLGRFSVKVINIGGSKEGDDVDGQEILLSLPRAKRIECLNILLPEYSWIGEKDLEPMPIRSLLASMIKGFISSVIVDVILYLLFIKQFPIWELVEAKQAELSPYIMAVQLAIIGLFTLFWPICTYFTRRVKLTDNEIYVSRGLLAKEMIRIPYDKIQTVKMVEGPIDRLLHVKNAEFQILASTFSSEYETPKMDTAIINALTAKAQAFYFVRGGRPSVSDNRPPQQDICS